MMTRPLLLLSSLIFSVLFLLFPDDKTVGYPFSDMVVTQEFYAYYLFEHLVLVVLALVIWELEPKYKALSLLFVIIQVVDTVDYILFYGDRWFNLVVTWNQIKVVIFGLAIVAQWINSKR
jgi:hypothetical protein